MTIDEAEWDNMNVVHPRAAGLDVHKASAAASVRVWKGDGETATRMFPAAHPGFREMAVRLSDCKVTAAAMEATGICREKPPDALEAAGIEAMVLNAQHVKQVRGRKTDVADCERRLHSELAGNRKDGQSLRPLQTIPGIGPAAGSILVELGPDIGVFSSHAHCAA